MSLDLSLVSAEEIEEPCSCPRCGNSHTHKVRETYFDTNITHNLNFMFQEAGLYQILWYGDGLRAGDVVPALEIGLDKMRENPHLFERFSDPEGWGTYRQAVPWLVSVIEACREYPDAVLECSR